MIVEVTIRGTHTNALLQHAAHSLNNGDKLRGNNAPNKTPREEAMAVAYFKKNVGYYAPTSWVMGMLRESGSYHKQKSSRKSVKYLVPAAIRLTDEYMVLNDAKTGKPFTSFEVDSRPVTIPSTKGKIIRHRPRFDNWMAKFTLTIEEGVLDEETVQRLLVEGGQRIGLGDFRPQTGGPFGTFRVTAWTILDGLGDEDPYAFRDTPPEAPKAKAPKTPTPTLQDVANSVAQQTVDLMEAAGLAEKPRFNCREEYFGLAQRLIMDSGFDGILTGDLRGRLGIEGKEWVSVRKMLSECRLIKSKGSTRSLRYYAIA